MSDYTNGQIGEERINSDFREAVLQFVVDKNDLCQLDLAYATCVNIILESWTKGEFNDDKDMLIETLLRYANTYNDLIDEAELSKTLV